MIKTAFPRFVYVWVLLVDLELVLSFEIDVEKCRPSVGKGYVQILRSIK